MSYSVFVFLIFWIHCQLPMAQPSKREVSWEISVQKEFSEYDLKSITFNGIPAATEIYKISIQLVFIIIILKVKRITPLFF